MEQNIGLRDVLNLLFKHKYKIGAIFFLVAVPTYVISARMPAHYMSKAVIMVSFGREFVPIPEVGDMRLPAPSQEAIINTEVELLAGRDLADTVIKTIGPQNLYPDLAKRGSSGEASRVFAVQRFGKDLQVKSISRSNLIEAYYKHENPRLAADALTTLINSLQDRHLQVFSNVKSSFLEEQLKSYEKSLQDSQLSLARFRESHQLLSEDTQSGILLKQQSDLGNELISATSKLAELRSRLGFLKNRHDLFLAGSGEQRSQLNALRLKEKEATQKYHDRSQVLIGIREDIKLVTQQMKEQEENMRNAEYFRIEAEIGPLELRIANLKRQIGSVESQIQAFGKDTAELQKLKREVAANDVNYQIYLKKVEEARISENMDKRKMTNITVVQQPTVPVASDIEAGNKVFRAGLLAALVLSLGVAFLFEYVPQTFSTPESVRRRLKVPVLAALEHRV